MDIRISLTNRTDKSKEFSQEAYLFESPNREYSLQVILTKEEAVLGNYWLVGYIDGHGKEWIARLDERDQAFHYCHQHLIDGKKLTEEIEGIGSLIFALPTPGATFKNGDTWTGSKYLEEEVWWFIATDSDGWDYETEEIPQTPTPPNTAGKAYDYKITDWPYPAVYNMFKAGDDSWREVSEETFYDQLGAVPPVKNHGNAFMVGEAADHVDGHEIHAAFVCIENDTGSRYFGRCDRLVNFSAARYKEEILEGISTGRYPA